MSPQKVDYSVYLVTDPDMVPEGLTLFDQVKKAVENGATIVQLREKTCDTGVFIERAQKVHEITKKAGVPLIINDRVDVALAVDAEGVHVGQDDMPATMVRKLIGPDKILGVSCAYPEEAQKAIEDKVVDYIGIGAMFDTGTKKNLRRTRSGPRGVREVLEVLRDNGGHNVKSVGIGGLNATNSSFALYQSSIPGKSLDGVAVVSCIMASNNAAKATSDLLSVVKNPVPWLVATPQLTESSTSADLITTIRSTKPLVHHITNGVVKNFSANITIAIGGSPVMSELQEEFTDLAKYPASALVLNTGTPSAEQLELYIEAIKAYNAQGKPVVFDPVGAGSSLARRNANLTILNNGHANIIKGNAGEIMAIAGIDSNMRGVDSVSTHSSEYLISVGKRVALENRCIVVITGKTDIVVDGVCKDQTINNHYDLPEASKINQQVQLIQGGHELMGEVTGSGCSLGSVIATFNATFPGDPFLATVSAIKAYKNCGEIAGNKSKSGPGTFAIEFVNALYNYK